MSEQAPLYNSVAPLKNVARLTALIERVQTRGPGLEGMAVFYGPSGFGKTTATVWAGNRYQAYSVEVKDSWTRKYFCTQVLREMGITPGRTIPECVDQISEALAVSDRPLLIDEADVLVNKGFIEVVRDIYRGSQGTVILIGEELLPQKLQRWERVHGRILDWVAAEEGTAEDVELLTRIYCPDIDIEPELKEALLIQSNRSIRRISNNLRAVRELGRTKGKACVGLDDWGDKPFITGVAPAPRRFT